MPKLTDESGKWDIQVQINGVADFQRVASTNHPIEVCTVAGDRTNARVCINPQVDRSFVPYKDFELFVRDEHIGRPTLMSTETPNGH